MICFNLFLDSKMTKISLQKESRPCRPNLIFFHFFCSKLNAGPKGRYDGSIESKLPSTLEANSGGWFGLEAHLCSWHVEHHSNHDADVWNIQMSDEEEPAPSAPVSDNDDNDDVASDSEQASMTQKRHKTGITKCEDEYAVSQRRQALSAKANTGKFLGLRAETEVFFFVCKRRFNPECFLFLQPVSRGLVLRPAFRCLTCLDLA